MHRFLECHFLLSVIAKFFALAHSIFGMIIAEKNKVQVTWHSGMHSSGNLRVQAITINSGNDTTCQPNVSDGWTVGVIGNVSNLCNVFYSCWCIIASHNSGFFPLSAPVKSCMIHCCSYSCYLLFMFSSWLEDHCNPGIKNMKYYTKKQWWTQPFSQSCEGLQLVCIALFVGNSAFHPQERQFLWNVRWLLSIRVHKCDVIHKHWMWLDADKDANFSSCASVDNKLATLVISSYVYELWVDCVGGSGSDEKRETHLTLTTVEYCWGPCCLWNLNYSFDMHSIDGLDEQNILKLEVALFCLKLKVSN